MTGDGQRDQAHGAAEDGQHHARDGRGGEGKEESDAEQLHAQERDNGRQHPRERHGRRIGPDSQARRGAYPPFVDAADWEEAVIGLGLATQDVQLLGRLLDVSEHLGIWRESGDRLHGTLAADALAQALGLLQELAGGEAARLVGTVESLLAVLPPPAE